MELHFLEQTVMAGSYEAIETATINVEDVIIIDETIAMPHLFPYLFKYDSSESKTAEHIFDNNWAHNKMQSVIKKARKRDFEHPNKFTNTYSVLALDCIKDNNGHLNFINPTVEGGSIIEFEKNDVQFVLEIDNSGEIALLKKAAIPEVDDLTEQTFLETLQSAIANA